MTVCQVNRAYSEQTSGGQVSLTERSSQARLLKNSSAGFGSDPDMAGDAAGARDQFAELLPVYERVRRPRS
jgi:hypothetical protein